jgi:lysozyme
VIRIYRIPRAESRAYSVKHKWQKRDFLMAGLDTTAPVKPTDGAKSGASEGAGATSKLSLEGNPGPGVTKAADASTPNPAVPASAPGETGRGHSAHAGNDHPNHLLPHIFPHETPQVTTTGIDVSEFQNTIDWTQVPSAGVKFAYIRATDGTTIQDSQFAQNWKGAEKAGILVGPYHYLTTTSPVDTQITNFVSTVKTVDAGNLPPVIDVEDPNQFAKYTVPQRIAMIQQMLDGVQQKLGVKPMLYMSSNFASEELNNTSQFDSYKLWVAEYTTNPQPDVPQPWKNWDFWQHTDSGIVPGITGGVDMDYFNGPEASIPTTTTISTTTSTEIPVTPPAPQAVPNP